MTLPRMSPSTLIGLLYGSDDFGQVQCIAVNCGEDTDCTAATAGSIWGIIHGAKAIPQKWIDPIGRGIKTVCLNLGELGYFGNQLPQTVDELTDRTIRLGRRMLARNNAEHFCSAPSPPVWRTSTSWNPKATRRRGTNSIWGRFQRHPLRLRFLQRACRLRAGGARHSRRPAEERSLSASITASGKAQANLLPPIGISPKRARRRCRRQPMATR